MNINEVFKLIEHTDITKVYISKINKPTLSNNEKKFLIRIIERFKSNDINDTLKAIKLYAIWEPDNSIKISRKKGVFRYKAYKLEDNSALYLLDEIIKSKNIFDFSELTIKYLEGKKQISWIFDFYKNSEKILIKYIKNHHKKRKVIKKENRYMENALFKDLLAYIDLTFSSESFFEEESCLNRDKLEAYSQEDICSAISYIIYLYDNIIGIKQDISYFIDSKYVVSDEIEYIILMACKAIQVQEWELCIDYFDYKINYLRNELVIFDENNLMEKSIRMGYARTQIQETIFYLESVSRYNDALSLELISSEIVKRMGKRMIQEINDGWLSRYRLIFSEELLKLFESETLFRKVLFKEEIIKIEYCANELIMTFEEAKDKQITEHCKLIDVLLFQRFFVFINRFFKDTIFMQEDENKIIQSLIPAFRKENFIKILNKFVNDLEKTKELVDLFIYKNSFKLDLQYTSLLEVSDNIIFPNTVISKSNILRNCIGYSYLIKNQVVNDDGGLEPLVKRCSELFLNHKEKYTVLVNKKFRYEKQNGEVDVIVVSEEDIILIECKCPLIPVNNFEMRSSLGHIEKANVQLTLSRKAFSDKSFRNNYFKFWGIEYKGQNIRTCIVFGNRLFSGYSLLEHPIRYIYELSTILNGGVLNSNLGKWSLWKGEEYNHKDLIDYLTEGNSLNQLNFEAMEEVEKTITVEGKKITFKSYAYNLIKAFQIYDKKLKIIESNDDLKKQIIDEYMEKHKNTNLVN